jgi:hypothetical protein
MKIKLPLSNWVLVIPLVLVIGIHFAWAANNFRQSTSGGTVTTFKSTDNAGVHTPHVNVDSAGTSSQYPVGAIPVTSSSANVVNASAVATLAANATRTTYICGLNITSGGATAASIVTPTVAGTVSGTMLFTYAVVAGATLGNAPVTVNFSPCVPGSAVNTAIVVTLPALGAGSTNATVNATGYQL